MIGNGPAVVAPGLVWNDVRSKRAGSIQAPAERVNRAWLIGFCRHGAFPSGTIVVANLGKSRGLLTGFGADHRNQGWRHGRRLCREYREECQCLNYHFSTVTEMYEKYIFQ
jgi:hypothetical protein